MRVVLDTNVLISSTIWDTSLAQKLLFKLISIGAEIFTSVEILSEYKNVLKRDFGYSDKEINNILEKLLYFAKLVETSNKINIVKADPEDNKIIECAVSSGSEYIVSYDKHLLVIGKFSGINILKPEDLLKVIGYV